MTGLILVRRYQAIEAFLALPKHVDIAHHALTATDIEVLEDIHDILEKSADVQQVLSGELTPTLAFTFPTYEALVTSLTKLASDLPIMRHYINLNVLKLKKYFLKCRRSRIFALAMCMYFYLSILAYLIFTKYDQCYAQTPRSTTSQRTWAGRGKKQNKRKNG